ncbi:MviM Predicted dehydrogenases and related proteins [Candidatus Nanopelagicaceae bacterium]
MTLRVGLAGYGLAGRYFHAPLLKGCGLELVAVLTTNPQRVEHVQSDFPEANVVADMQQLLSHDLDLVIIASVNSVHVEQAIAALHAGVPTVVDKPMGRNLTETLEILKVSDETGVPVTAFYNRLFDSDSLTIKRVIQENEIGKVFRIDSRFERYRPDLAAQSWREQSSAADGGGLLLDLQSHLVSTALDWFGPAELISASVRSVRGASDDDVVLVLKHESGVDSYLSASAIVGAPGPRIRMLGSNGALVIGELDPQEALLRAGKVPHEGKWDVPTKSEARIIRGEVVSDLQVEDGNYAQFYALVTGAIAGKNAWPVSKAEIIAVATIIDKARELNFRE